jgi:ATP-dependent Clp protease ATP-binding subunit ClpC
VPHLPVYLRSLADGRVTASLIDFPNLAADGPDSDSALAALEIRASEGLRWLTAALRYSLSIERDIALRSVKVTVTPEGSKREELQIVATVAFWSRDADAGTVQVIRAPSVADVDLAVSRVGDIDTAARRQIAKQIRDWPVSSILGVHEPSPGSLAVIDVTFAMDSPRRKQGEEDFTIEAAGEELTRLAGSGRLGRLDQRDPIVERVLAALAAPGRSSVMLIGPRDVGKTALIGEVAARMAAGDVPPALGNRRLWRISANELIAGARFIGMWQNRARVLLAHARAQQAVYVMGDPIAIVDAGRWSESSNNLGRVLQPAIESGELSVVCECTPEALSALTKQEPGFLEAFHRIEMREPGMPEVERIVVAASGRLAAAHGIEFEASAAPAAIELTTRFEPYNALPGKAIRLLEDVVQRSVGADGTDPLDREDVTAAFSQRTGLPRSVLSDEVRLDLSETTAFLERRVLGQPAAVAAMVDIVAVIKAGLQAGGKPLGSYFFVGPTGVGKTELAKALAELLFSSRERMVRFDMGEYRSGDAVAKLIGSGWRSEEEGELTRRIREQPFCVLLLDEIEKAHADVFDALLSVLGEGRLTDASGRTADFRNVVVIMTSNLGATRVDRQGVGFATDAGEALDTRRQRFVAEAERFFRPEFFNRIDQVVVFDSLDRETIQRIARREIGRLIMRGGITRRQLLIEVDDSVIDHCAEAGFHPQYGARPLQRQIEDAISRPLARLVVSRAAEPGSLVRFRMAGGEVAVDLHETPRVELEAIARASKPSEDLNFEKAEQAATELIERLAVQAEDPLVEAITLETERLLDSTHSPGFWDDPDQAREVLSRYYQLDRCAGRFASLRDRADGLSELAVVARRSRQKSRLSEIREAISEISEMADLLQLEMSGAASGTDANVAHVSVIAVGAGAEGWRQELLAMYAAWAERTGRRAELNETSQMLEIDGLSSYQLLRAEGGLHRIADGEHSSVLARVLVREHPDDDAGESAEIVRQYYRGRRQFVRDPRTGVRVKHTDAVLLEGRIDPFLIAAARERVVAS